MLAIGAKQTFSEPRLQNRFMSTRPSNSTYHAFDDGASWWLTLV